MAKNITAEAVLKENYTLKEASAIIAALAQKLTTAEKPSNMISAYTTPDGKFLGVRVCVGGEDFVIEPHDLKDGEEMTWYEAMALLKEVGKTTWNYRQICLTMAFKDEINALLKENGGDPLDQWYWACAEYSAYDAFIYNGNNGNLYHYNKDNTYSCRGLLAL